MTKTFRFLLFLSILLGMIATLFLETRLQVSTGGHKLVQILIVTATCWLAWRWVQYDEMRSLTEARKSKPVQHHYRIASPAADAKILQNMDIHFSPARAARALMSVGIVFALTVAMLSIGSKTLGEGVIALLYLIPIGWCTVRWGQLAGVSAALTAALSFDFLFIPPYGTFNIGSVEGWLLLFLFIATAILVVGRIQTILTEERERERKATFLYEVVAAISNEATREGIARAIAHQIQQKFLAKRVQVQLIGGWGDKSFSAHVDIAQASEASNKPDRALAIVSGQALIGEIDFWQGSIPLPSEDDPMMQTMLRQISSALDRVRVAEGKPPYPKQKPSYSEGNSFQTSQS